MKTKSKVKVKSKRDETVIKCPECGATFRVGKALVQTKGEAASARVAPPAGRAPPPGPPPRCPFAEHTKRKGNEMNKETIRELRERADGMITATLADSRVRSCVHDIEFDFVRRDGRHDVQDVINLELDRRTAADEMPHVTPDTVVKCPECGATFRVGKALV